MIYNDDDAKEVTHLRVFCWGGGDKFKFQIFKKLKLTLPSSVAVKMDTPTEPDPAMSNSKEDGDDAKDLEEYETRMMAELQPSRATVALRETVRQEHADLVTRKLTRNREMKAKHRTRPEPEQEPESEPDADDCSWPRPEDPVAGGFDMLERLVAESPLVAQLFELCLEKGVLRPDIKVVGDVPGRFILVCNYLGRQYIQKTVLSSAERTLATLVEQLTSAADVESSRLVVAHN